MARENKPLNELKCRDCAKYVLTGWWDKSKVCNVSGLPIDPDSPACISFYGKQICQKSK